MMKFLTSKPGEFRAVCNLRRRIPWSKMTEQLWALANARGYSREFREMASGRVDREAHKKGRWEVVFGACEGFETTDREAFERHIAELHDGGPMRWDVGMSGSTSKTHGMPVPLPVRPWRAPALLEEGRPWTDDELTRTCSTCGLVAEIADGFGQNSAELWWAEHQRGCALASQAAS